MRGWSSCVVCIAALSACDATSRSAIPGRTLELTEVSRFGGIEGSGDLTWVTSVVPSGEELLVLDSRSPRLSIFTRDGEWVRDVGRSGDGPGELRRPQTISVRGESIVIGDPSGRRMEVLSRDGASLQSTRWSIAADSLGVAASPLLPLADGSILAVPSTLPIGGVISGGVTHRNYYAAATGGRDPRLLYRETVARADFVEASAPSGGVIVGAHPHRQSPLVAPFVDGSGLVVVERVSASTADSTTFRLKVIEPDGSEVTDRAVPYQPQASSGWRDQYRRDMEQQMLDQSGAVDHPFVDAVVGALPDFSFYPPVTELMVGDQGGIWLRREAAAADSVEWQLYSREGERLGSTTLSVGARAVGGGIDGLWVAYLDEYDVPEVVYYRVRPPEPSE